MKKLFGLLLLLVTGVCFAQINFEQGTFTKNDGQVVNCLIKNVDWKNNPVNFTYKLNETDYEKKTGIADVISFEVGNHSFWRFTVNIDRSSSEVSDMSNHKDPDFKEEILFLKKIAGDASMLYRYEDGNIVRYFASKGSSTPEQLIHKPYLVAGGISYNDSYKGQLYRLMKDKFTGNTEYKNVRYNDRDLIKLFTLYNGNENDEKSHVQKKSASVSVKFLVGARYMSTSNKNIDVGGNFDLGGQLTPMAGIELETILPFNNNKWAVFIQPQYQSYSKGKTSTFNGEINPLVDKWDINYKSIDVPLGIRHYFFLNNNSKISISAAYLYSFKLFGSKVNFSRTGNAYNYQKSAEILNNAGLMVASGYYYKNAGIELRYNFKRSLMSNNAFWTSKYSGLSLSAIYKMF